MSGEPSLEERVRSLVAAGDVREAATLVMQSLGPSILRFLRSVLQDEADVGDAFSDFAESMWKSLGRFRGEAALRTWALRIAWNAAYHVRNQTWRRRSRRFATHEASALAEEVRTRTAVKVEREQQALDTLRRELSLEEQSLLALRIDQGLAWEEIAEVLARTGTAVSTAALWKRFERLKVRLAEMAKERGLLD